MTRGKYTVNEVEERTKVPGSTLRQWERRYGFPKPERSEAGYRLYSDQDLGHIGAMKRHIAEGIPASRAAELVRGLLPAVGGARPLTGLRDELVGACIELDEESAARLLSEAHALHPIDAVVLDLIVGTVAKLDELCQRDAIERARVGFAVSFLNGRLRALFDQTPMLRGAPAVLVACAPGNRQETAPLALAVTLRRDGYRVYYLGPDVHVADVASLTARLRPTAVLLWAVGLESLEVLEREEVSSSVSGPLLGFGGAAFNRFPESAQALGGLFIGGDARAGLENLRRQLRGGENA
jgi:DNA-binding transcriptional MerR regulator